MKTKNNQILLILNELREHIPFTAIGSVISIVIMLIFFNFGFVSNDAELLFEIMHPLHIMLSAFATASLYRLYNKKSVLKTLIVGYLGAVIIGSISDCVIPYIGEWILNMPNRGLHLGVIEMWWLVNPLAILFALFAHFKPIAKLPHALHVFISTFASLFHVMMAIGQDLSLILIFLIFVFLFLAVWIPCCSSDIIFPMIFVRQRSRGND